MKEKGPEANTIFLCKLRIFPVFLFKLNYFTTNYFFYLKQTAKNHKAKKNKVI